jgi:hypothetical protein
MGNLSFPDGAFLCHTSTHGKQRQRQEGSQESAEAQAKTGTRPQTRRVHANPAEVGRQPFGFSSTSKQAVFPNSLSPYPEPDLESLSTPTASPIDDPVA